MALTRDQLMNAQGVPLRKVSLPEWGDDAHVFIRPMPARIGELFANLKEGDDEAEHEATQRALIACVCNEDGSALFSDGDDVHAMPIVAFKRLADAIVTYNGMTDEGAAELAGNSNGSPGDASPSS